MFGESGFVSKAALGRGSSLLPSTVFVFPPAHPSFGTLRQCWVLSAIAQYKPQPLLVSILDLVALGHQKAAAVGCAHPSTVDTVQRCALCCFVEGNSDEFVITLTT